MDQALAAPDLATLNEKLDLLTVQVQFLTEQARLAASRQEERAELVHDVIPIANDVFRIAVEQLEEMQDSVDLSDLLRLLKHLLRNARNIDRMLDRLMVDNVVASFDEPVDASLRSLLRQMRDPNVRRGLALGMRALGVVGGQAAGKQHT